ncbi:MAG: DUF4258 domain-containing protein [Thermoprotei archaeon]|nr:MAG: DUF4258 domain-containing protein [Thermoprotei archaeon]
MDDTTIKLSKHAIARMRERKISLEEVHEAVNDPFQLVYDMWNDVYIVVSIRGIAVVYALHGKNVEVLTVLSRREYEALLSKHGSKRYKVIM